MSTIMIDLPEEHLTKLRVIAAGLNISLEDLARLSIEGLLAQPEDQFDQAARYVLEKNADLYRCLA